MTDLAANLLTSDQGAIESVDHAADDADDRDAIEGLLSGSTVDRTGQNATPCTATAVATGRDAATVNRIDKRWIDGIWTALCQSYW